MYYFPFRCRVPQLAGIGVLGRLIENLNTFGCKKVMVVHGTEIEALGHADTVRKMIREAGIEVVDFGRVLPDPPDYIVNEGAELGRKEKIDGIVSVGGGSAIDTAKGIKLLQTNDGTIEEWLNNFTRHQNLSVPLICIPTTSGTGSEATNGGIITDTKKNIKCSIAGDACRCDIALIDPVFTSTMGPELTAACAFDALSHCVDAMTSVKTNAVTQAVAREGVRLFIKSVYECYFNPENEKARSEMQVASTLGGIAISSAACSATHGFAHALGAAYHVPHGDACAIFLPAYIEYVAEACPEQIEMLADVLNVNYSTGDSSKEIAARIARMLGSMAKAFHIPTIRDYVPNIEDAYKLIPVAAVDIQGLNSPVKITEETGKWFIDKTYSYQF